MDILFLCVTIFLFLLAIFHLSVGVSNDAVNFLNSAVGSKAASFKRIIIVASIGVFIGAAMSNGMMDIARHGIFRPEQFSFYDIICIFMAVMVTDIILLDIFNTLGMPTSTTVSLIFELLGASFAVSMLKLAGDNTGLVINDLLNTEKALSVIIGIFLSVAIAFVFGTVVQFITRVVFSFDYRNRIKWKIGLFGGLCSTAIIYFLLIKGMNGMAFMTPAAKEWVDGNTLLIVCGSLVVFTAMMQLLYAIKVNVLKVIVLMGTFALAMAFAGNDLVNFIGVPLSGLASYNDYAAHGAGDAHGFMMYSLNEPARTPIYFLLGAGAVMVISLATSKKARKVTQTEIGLGSKDGDEEMFGTSRIARRLVRGSLSALAFVSRMTPTAIRQWIDKRFDDKNATIEQGAAFDLVRGSVNLVLAGALIALGTSMKLPLSTTFVTFMVAMGSSLADRAWSRESAVFRITGVISVIGGWFITAGAAFIGAGLIVILMHFGGQWVMIALGILTIVLIIRSNRRFNSKAEDNTDDELLRSILSADSSVNKWELLRRYIIIRQQEFIAYAEKTYLTITTAFLGEDLRTLDKSESALNREKENLKNTRRKETLCLRQIERATAIENNTWFHLGNNCCMSIFYNLQRINEMCKDHIEKNFHPLPQPLVSGFDDIRSKVSTLFNDTSAMMDSTSIEAVTMLRRQCDEIKDQISDTYHNLHDRLREGDQSSMTVTYAYINILQETQEMVSALRKYLRAYAKLCDPRYSSRNVIAN